MANPLMAAIKGNDLAGVLNILENKPNSTDLLNREYGDDERMAEEEVAAIPLHVAVSLELPEMVNLLLSLGADPNLASENFEQTPLELATTHLHLNDENRVFQKMNMLNMLLFYGANLAEDTLESCINLSVELKNQNQNLQYSNNAKIIALLQHHKIYGEFLYVVQNGDLNAVTAKLNQTYTVQNPYNNKEILCQFQINPNYHAGMMGSAILHAATLETPSMLQLLLSKGASLNREDLQGNTVFHYAASQGRTNNIQWIFDNLSQEISEPNRALLLNKPDKIFGNTPLHCATQLDFVDSIERLLALGASSAIQNAAKQTPQSLSNSISANKLFEMYASGRVPSLTWLTAKHVPELTPKKRNRSLKLVANISGLPSLLAFAQTQVLPENEADFLEQEHINLVNSPLKESPYTSHYKPASGEKRERMVNIKTEESDTTDKSKVSKKHKFNGSEKLSPEKKTISIKPK